MKSKLLISLIAMSVFMPHANACYPWCVGNYNVQSPLSPYGNSYYNPAIYNNNFFYAYQQFDNIWANMQYQGYSQNGTTGMLNSLLNAANFLTGGSFWGGNSLKISLD